MVNKSIILSVLVIGVAVLLAGAGTWAYFTDTEKSVGNTFTAGVLDVEISQSFHFEGVAPGSSKTESIEVNNSRAASIEADEVYLEFDVTDQETNDDTDSERTAENISGITNVAGTNRGSTDISKLIEITSMEYNNNVNTIYIYSDSNNNGYIDLDDLNKAEKKRVNGDDKLSRGEIAHINFTMLLRPNAPDTLQGDTSIVDEIVTVVQTD